MNIKKFLALSVVGALMFGSLAVKALAVGTNGSFENGIDTGPSHVVVNQGDNSIADWTVDSGNVDYIGPLWEASDGLRSIDLNGFEAGSISQTLTTIPGAIYKIEFDLSGNPGSWDIYWSPSNKEVLVSATGALSQSFYYDTVVMGNSFPSPMKWVKGNTYSFIASETSTTLTFASQIVGAFGPVLDNVVTTEYLLTTKDQCKKDSWKTFGVFKNQGDCVSFIATNGRNLPVNNP